MKFCDVQLHTHWMNSPCSFFICITPFQLSASSPLSCSPLGSVIHGFKRFRSPWRAEVWGKVIGVVGKYTEVLLPRGWNIYAVIAKHWKFPVRQNKDIKTEHPITIATPVNFHFSQWVFDFRHSRTKAFLAGGRQSDKRLASSPNKITALLLYCSVMLELVCPISMVRNKC